MNYITTHDTAAGTMTHVFENGYKVIVYWNIKKAIKVFDKTTESISIGGMSIQDYHNMLLKIASEVTPKCN